MRSTQGHVLTILEVQYQLSHHSQHVCYVRLLSCNLQWSFQAQLLSRVTINNMRSDSQLLKELLLLLLEKTGSNTHLEKQVLKS
jgi:hypothetical protein